MQRIMLGGLMALAAAGASGAAQALGADEGRQQGAAMAAMHHDDAPVASPAVQPVPEGSVEGRDQVYGSLKGKPLKGYFVKPAKAAPGLPGVIVFHEWWGLNDNIRRMADRLAAQGYLVLAADLYGGHAAEKPDEAQALMQQATADGPGIDANIQAAYDWLKSDVKAARVGTLGWCFGGSLSFEAGQVLGGRTAATVIYYGFVNNHPDELNKLKAPVAGFFGGQDKGIPPETVQGFQKELEAEGKHPLIRIYPDAGHAFANPSGKNYRNDDAEDAWKRTLDFLGEHLKG
jgi:carboxymethylenebutenolidase